MAETATKKKASKSGNPARRAEAKTSSIADFKKRKAGALLELPSGLNMRCRKVELTTFLKQGSVPNELMPIIDEALSKGQAMDTSKLVSEDGKVDLDMVRQMYEMVNAVVCQIAVEPKVLPEPEDEVDRDDGLLYVDEVDDEDKMFLFQWAIGGTSDLAQFREGLKTDLGSLAEGQGHRSPAKRTGGARRK